MEKELKCLLRSPTLDILHFNYAITSFDEILNYEVLCVR